MTETPDAEVGVAPELSVVICTRNRRENLVETLESLGKQQWDGDWEVLVVDNAGTQELEPALGAVRSQLSVPLRVEREEQPGLSYARNRALELARGRVVAFIDDDVTCLPGWVSTLGDAFRNESVTVAGGPIRPLLPVGADPWLGSILETEIGGPSSRYEFGDQVADIVRAGPIPAPFGANMSVLRQVALDAGGFDTRLGWGRRMVPSEEFDFFRRVLSGGACARYLPRAVVLHRIERDRTTKEYWHKWQRGLGRSLILMDPPSGPVSRAGKLARYCWKALRAEASARLARSLRDFQREVYALRKREQAVGRLLELAGR